MSSPIPPPLSVVIPTYGNWWLIERCLDALDTFGLPGQQVIVVDDVSPDQTRAQLAERRGLEVLFAARNQGFAAGCNMGALVAASDKLLFLNADTEVRRGALQALVAALDDETIGAVGARLLYPDGTIQHAGVVVDHAAMPTHAHWFRYGRLPDALVPRDYPAVTGAALLVRTAEFRALGGFDTSFRNGFEDVDLCFRIWARGKRVRYEPAAEVLHIESVSEGRHAHEMANARLLVDRWGPLLTPLAAPQPPALKLTMRRVPPRGALGDEARRLFAAAGGQPGNAAPPEPEGLDAAVGMVFAAQDEPTRNELALVAPTSIAEARSLDEQLAARRYLVPTLAARALLREAGIACDRVDLWRAGFPADLPAQRSDAIVFYVSDVTSAAHLATAVATWLAVRDVLAPRGASFRLHVALPEAAWTALRDAALRELGATTFPSDVAISALGPFVTEPDALQGAHTLLAVGPTDRVGRISLLALALRVDVVGSGELHLDGLRDRGVARLADDEAALRELLIASFAENATRRTDRLEHAQREVRRAYGPARMALACRMLLFDSAQSSSFETQTMSANRVPQSLLAS
jgi:GT2 family glycosyltransferase